MKFIITIVTIVMAMPSIAIGANKYKRPVSKDKGQIEKGAAITPGGEDWKEWSDVQKEEDKKKNKLYQEPYAPEPGVKGQGEIEELEDYESDPSDTND